MLSIYLMYMIMDQVPVRHDIYPLFGSQEMHVHVVDEDIYKMEIKLLK